MSYYLHWAYAGLFGYIVQWWFWGAVGLAGAIAAFILLPAVVPSRLRLLISGAILMVGFMVAAGSWGMARGIATEREYWDREVAKEKLRLQGEARRNLEEEQARTASAENTSAKLKGQLDDLLAKSTIPTEEAPPSVETPTWTVDTKSGKVNRKAKGPRPRAPHDGTFIPEPDARGVSNLRGRR